jgi:hypothetical protein
MNAAVSTLVSNEIKAIKINVHKITSEHRNLQKRAAKGFPIKPTGGGKQLLRNQHESYRP